MRCVLFTGVLLLFATCKKGHRLDCVKTAGEIVTETFAIESFSKIHVKHTLDLELVYSPDKNPAIEITFNKNLLPGINREVKNGELLLQNNNVCNWVRSYRVQPRVKLFYNNSLRHITIDGAAKVYNRDTMRLRDLTVVHNGVEDVELTMWDVNGIECNGFNTGGFKLHGQAGYLTCTMDDIAFIDTRNLILDDLYVFHYSLRSSYVRSRNIMEIKLYGQGDVYLEQVPSDSSRWGCCRVELTRLGKGQFK